MVSDWNTDADSGALVAKARSAVTAVIAVVIAAIVPAAVATAVPAAIAASVAEASIIIAAVIRLVSFSFTTICVAAMLVVQLDSNSLIAVSLLLPLMVLADVLLLSVCLVVSALPRHLYSSFLLLLLPKLSLSLCSDAPVHIFILAIALLRNMSEAAVVSRAIIAVIERRASLVLAKPGNIRIIATEVHLRIASIIGAINLGLVEVSILAMNVVDDYCSVSPYFLRREGLRIVCVVRTRSARHSIALEGVMLVAILRILPTAIVYISIAGLILPIIAGKLPLVATPAIHVAVVAVAGVVAKSWSVGHGALLRYDARAEGYACLYTYS